MTDAHRALRDSFGYPEFRPGQETIIQYLLAGHSAAAVFPTGGGKSLCFQLPALLLPGTTLVVSPLIALMKDQIDQLKRRGIAAERLDSTMSAVQTTSTMNALRSGTLKLLYVAPERFNNERFRHAIEKTRVSLFAIDEAHCISEWGHNFRPDYLKLSHFSKMCGAERRLALTATATPEVLSDICRNLEIRGEHTLTTGFYRPNLSFLFTHAEDADRDRLLVSRFGEKDKGPAIVYTTLRKTAERVSEVLRAVGVAAKPYHAGLGSETRGAVQEWFLKSNDAVVVATIAFGMGIDKSDIRRVIHYNLPKSLESYSQEVGRAGRDGQAAVCEVLVCTSDVRTLENFAYGDTPSAQSIRDFVEEVFSSWTDFSVSHSQLSNQFDIRPLVVNTLFAYLQLDGYLEGGTPHYHSYHFRPLQSLEQIAESFSGERRDFLKRLWNQCPPYKNGYNVQMEGALPKERVERALTFLSDEGFIQLRVEGVLNRYRIIHRPESNDDLAKQLSERMLERERRELQRIGQVVSLAAHGSCQTKVLATYFGQQLEKDCGHCTGCLTDKKKRRLPKTKPAAIDSRIWDEVEELRSEEGNLLRDHRTIARFLCGIQSPKLIRNRLDSDPLFGVLGGSSFSQILKEAEQRVVFS